MKQITYYKKEEDSDNVYANIRMHNPIEATQLIFAEIKDVRDVPYIDNIEDYYLSVIRFRITSVSIPIFVARIQEGQFQSDPDLTIYSVTLSYAGDDYLEYLHFIPNNTLTQTPQPLPPSLRPQYGYTQDFGQYYFVYFIRNLIDMINNAFQAAFTRLKTAHPGAPPTEAPYALYDNETNLISIVTQTSYLPPNSIEVWWNAKLQSFIDGIPTVFNGFDVGGEQKSNQLVIQYNGHNAYFKQLINAGIPATADYLIFTQESVNAGQWYTLRNIIFTTHQIPITPENISGLNEQGKAVTASILTDYSPTISQVPQFRSDLQFYNTGPYRLLDLAGAGSQNIIDIKLYWQDSFEIIHPLTLVPAGRAEIKLLFIKKDLYKGGALEKLI